MNSIKLKIDDNYIIVSNIMNLKYPEHLTGCQQVAVYYN